MRIQAPKGTKDIYGEETYIWQEVEKIILETCRLYNIEEIRTPMFEHSELFLRGVGETTDIVQKEMYTFNDKGGRSITLKPEGTAGVARAYIEHGLHVNKQPTKLFYVSSFFRYEQPQSGRFREFHQFGVEFLGSQSPACDVEVMSLAYTLFQKLGINNIMLYINSLGCPTCRNEFNTALKTFLSENLQHLCPTCQERFEKNPLRILDCKEEKCQKILENAPTILDSLDPDCQAHFELVQKMLTNMGIPFKVNSQIVRGLDYYTRTVFEFVREDVGVQGTVCGGGRYDGLIEQLGGQPTPGIGFGLGLERLVLTLQKMGSDIGKKPICHIYIGSIGENGNIKAQGLVYQLRQKGIVAESDIVGRSVKAQMKYADKLVAQYSLIIGEDEIAQNKANIKNMQTGEQKEVSLDGLYEFIIENKE